MAPNSMPVKFEGNTIRNVVSILTNSGRHTPLDGNSPMDRLSNGLNIMSHHSKLEDTGKDISKNGLLSVLPDGQILPLFVIQ